MTSEVLRELEKIFEFEKWGIWPKSTQFTSGRERLKTTAHRAPRTFFAGSIFQLDRPALCVAM